MLLLFLLAIKLALIFYLYMVYTRFSRYGVKNLIPVPIIGTIFKFLCKMAHVTEEYTRLRKRFPYDRFVGKFIALTPVVVVFDPEVIKRILMRDFHHFRHRTFGKQKEKDDLQGSSLFFLAEYQEWKLMRRTMIQSFTSAKINGHLPKLRKVGQKIVDKLRGELKCSKDDYIDIETRNMVIEFVLRSIASCALDLEFENYDDFRQFCKKTLTVSMFEFSTMIKIYLLNNYPKITEYIKLRLYPESTKRYFRKMLTKLMDEREASSITKQDILQVLVNARKDWPDDYLIAQVILILDPARDTVIEAASCLLYELVMHPEVLKRLVKEIDDHAIKYGGNLEALNKMTYLEMVISETLRLWPPSPLVDRTCTIDYNLGKPNNMSSKDYIIKKGEHLHIPVSVIQRDPQHFPDPLKFDPERFSEENRKKINPFVYMPFGGGRRMCPGARLAICEIKVLTIELLRNLELSPAPNTPKIAKLSRRSVLMELENYIRVRERRK